MRKRNLRRLTFFYLMVLVLGLGLTVLEFPSLALAKIAAQEVPEKVVLDHFPIYNQRYNLSCEYSATRMITAYWGHEINDTEFNSVVPLNSNPHLGFRGDINGYFGGTWDYGVYAEPIAKVLETRGFKTKLLVAGPEALKRELALGRPVQVWTVAGMGWSNPYTESYEGLSFKLAASEHSEVIYGYDSQGVYVADPGYGTDDYYSWGTFLHSWGYFDYMAMSVWPADQPIVAEKDFGVAPEFYRAWLNQGGLLVFGYPISEAKIYGSKVIQYFERVRFEANLEKPDKPIVSLGLLGNELTYWRNQQLPFRPATQTSNPALTFFEATDHTLSGEFKTFWEKYGGLANFGYPISEIFGENGRIVQYFERARFELDLPLTPESRVQLGRLGAEQLKLVARLLNPSVGKSNWFSPN
ncbi:MAG: C39 family peptidase [Chloroflexota bacterium]